MNENYCALCDEDPETLTWDEGLSAYVCEKCLRPQLLRVYQPVEEIGRCSHCGELHYWRHQ